MNSPASLFFALLVSLFLFGASASAQDQSSDDLRAGNQGRVNVLRQLGLSPAQLQQIKTINQARRPTMQEAQSRVLEASRKLDQAIYSDVPNEAEVQSRLKDFQQAQAEVSRIRFSNEFAIRKVLTAEQLGRFRNIRRKFAAAGDDRQKWPAGPPANARKDNIRRMIRSGKRPF